MSNPTTTSDEHSAESKETTKHADMTKLTPEHNTDRWTDDPDLEEDANYEVICWNESATEAALPFEVRA